MQDGKASIEQLGRLIVVHPEVKATLILSEEEVLFLTEDSTMIWDISQNQASVWLTEDIPNNCEVGQPSF